MHNNQNNNTINRKSIRLKGYNYSQPGLYFVTICCQNRKHFFGEIQNGKMILNEAGTMIEKWYYELENKFEDIKCGEMVVMPNHFHCIIQNIGYGNGSDRPVYLSNEKGRHVGLPLQQSLLGEHIGSPLHRVVQWFKTMTTNEYIRGVKNRNWKRFNGKLWQRNYWEHIIRNDQSHTAISRYIKINPAKWELDK